MVLVSQERELEIGLETLDLPSEMISADPYIQPAYEILAAFFGTICCFGEQD